MNRGAVRTSLAITGLAVLIHLKVLQAMGSFITAKTHGTDVDTSNFPPAGSVAKWGVAFVGLSVVMVAASDSPNFSEPMGALGVLIAGTAVIAAWPDIQAMFKVDSVAGVPVNYGTIPHSEPGNPSAGVPYSGPTSGSRPRVYQ